MPIITTKQTVFPKVTIEKEEKEEEIEKSFMEKYVIFNDFSGCISFSFLFLACF